MPYLISANIDLSIAAKCEDLKKENKLSGLVNKLLMEYFAAEDNKAPVLVPIRAERDVVDYISKLRLTNPKITNAASERLKINLVHELDEGEFIINLKTGEHQKTARIAPVEDGTNGNRK